MIRSRYVFAATLAACVACGPMLAVPAHAADEKKVSQKVGEPLKAAQTAIQGGKFQAALGEIAKAEAVEGRTEYENYLIAVLREQCYLKLSDWANVAKMSQVLMGSGEVSGTALQQQDQVYIEALGNLKDYAHLSDAISKYYRDGGTDPRYRQMVVQAYYQAGDFANAAKAERAAIVEKEKSGAKPPETEYQLLMSAEYKQSPTSPGYLDALLRLDAAYPKDDYWNDTLLAIRKKPGFSDKFRFDNDRLLVELGLVKDPDELVDYAETALQIGYPGYGKTFMDAGYASKLLGTGPNAARQKKLMDLAIKSIADDQKVLAQEKSAASTGSQWLKLGDAYASYSQYDDAIAAYTKALSLGTFKNPVDGDMTRLHLGIAYLKSGNKAKAKETFATLAKADNGSYELGEVWAISNGLK